MLRWLLSLFGGGSRLRARDIRGCVVVGGNSGIVYQIYNGDEPPEPPSLPWDRALPTSGPFEIFNLLRWTSRLSPQLIGREQHKQDLLDWATSGGDLRIRLLIGPGGAGKTRLAAEVAQSLRDDGWHAGFTSLGKSVSRPLSDKGLLLIVDYPRNGASRSARCLSARRKWRLRPPDPRAASEPAADGPLARGHRPIRRIGALRPVRGDGRAARSGGGGGLFRMVATRLARHRKVDMPRLDDAAIIEWIERGPALHPLPLFTTAAAIHAIIEPGETLGLSGAQIITALVERERRRLDAAGRNAGWGERAASRLAGLAALRAVSTRRPCNGWQAQDCRSACRRRRSSMR